MSSRASEYASYRHRVMIFGGDGFCGWPMSLYLSRLGYQVVIVDDQSRRQIDAQLGIESLTPICSIEDRINAWQEVSGQNIRFAALTLGRQYDELAYLLREFEPDTIIHFAEQRSAPYSMKSPGTKKLTIDNNVRSTHDLLCALVDTGLNAHVIHLGSIGVYGYHSSGFPRPEGYYTVFTETQDGRFEEEILYPTNPGSIYHLTKAIDQLVLQYYSKNDSIRITDLHQGIVWGTQTDETVLDDRLLNRFDYDGDYGTVVNRFLVQAALGYPLTVHGTGQQTRAFIHIRDTLRCIELALLNPPRYGERVRILNQVSETRSVIDLARLISRLSGTPYNLVENPRFELEVNELEVQNGNLLDLGFTPTILQDSLFKEITEIATKYASRCDLSKIPSSTRWRFTSPHPQTSQVTVG